jgi:hypothetical protein
MLVTRAAWPVMKAAGRGRIVNTTSVAFQGWSQSVAYSASKAAIYGLTRTLASDGKAHGIVVNAIAPGGATRMLRRASPGLSPTLLAQLEELADPSYNAAVVGFLAHPSCRLNGEVLSCQGGRITRMFVAETVGYLNRSLTVEDVGLNLPTIMNEDGYRVFQDGEASAASTMSSLADFVGAEARIEHHK